MIEQISISGLGVIEQATIAPGPGFTALTGETGAGKTLVLSALSLLMGGKPAPSLVRGERARIDGCWRIAQDSALAQRVTELGGTVEEGELLVGRTVPKDGRSRATIGGIPIPAATLAELTGDLLAVHGQADQFRLRRTSSQRAQLDSFGGDELGRTLAEYREGYQRLRQVEEELQTRRGEARTRAAEADYLRFGLEEVASLDPQPGEDRALAEEDERLGNVDALSAACETAHGALSGDDGGSEDVLARIAGAARALDQAATHDRVLGELATRLREAAVGVAEVSSDIAGHAASLELDPQRLGWVQERRASLNRLCRKYGDSVDDVLEWARDAAVRLADLDDDDSRIEQLSLEGQSLRTELGEAAGRLSKLRRAAAEDLSAVVSAELTALAMPDARFNVDVTSREDASGLLVGDRTVVWGPDGVDDVVFQLAPHRGAEPAPIGQGASGGELSRVMLAIEVACAGSAPVPTMVFDEVDAGVGGKAAVEIGRRLSRLAAHTQVIVVTHLPQVAAFAQTQLLVTKGSAGLVTAASVTEVTGDDRRREIARMLAGQDDSAHALAHADELLALGAAEGAFEE